MKFIAICFCLFLSGTILAQSARSSQKSTQANNEPKPKKRRSAKDIIGYKKPVARIPSKASSLYQRKFMPVNKEKVWILGTEKNEGHWSYPQSNEKGGNLKNQSFYNYPISQFENLKPYDEAFLLPPKHRDVIKTTKLPVKKIDLEKIVYDADWSDHGTSAVYKDGEDHKLNLSFFKNIKKNSNFAFPNDFDHIIVTDTLFAPVTFLNSNGIPRRDKRSYIKIVANCIIYEKPISLNSWKSRSKTDYVFSSKEIIFKSKFKNLKPHELNPIPPFVFYDSYNIRVHKDPYKDDESILINRLFIEIISQITSTLNGSLSIDAWKRDDLLIEFQKYRYRVNTEILHKDEKYKNKFDQLVGDFKTNFSNEKLKKDRKFEGIDILVEGELEQLHITPFKYYALPSKATLLPAKNEKTGDSDKLGRILFKTTGDSEISLNLDIKLGYNDELVNKANQKLKEKGFFLEKTLPKTTMFIDQQPLQIKGKTIKGLIIPISSEILRLEIELPDDQYSLLNLFPKSNDVTFDIIYKMYENRKELPQEINLKVPDKLLDAIDYESMLSKFNTIQKNTISDQIKITSNLSSSIGSEEDGEGALNYLEVSFEILFDNQETHFFGPIRFPSAFVQGSEQSIEFLKHSDNYSIKITGKAYYENGIREIKENVISTGPFVELDENMFKDIINN